jgi:hypothetical protein
LPSAEIRLNTAVQHSASMPQTPEILPIFEFSEIKLQKVVDRITDPA